MTNPDYITKTYTFAGETPVNTEVAEIEMRNHAGGWGSVAIHIENDCAVGDNLTFRAEMGTKAVGSGTGVFLSMCEPDEAAPVLFEVVNAASNKIFSIFPTAGTHIDGATTAELAGVLPINSEVVYLLVSGNVITGTITMHIYRGR